ncbi:phospholipid transfer protein [Rhinatrema bivittatum]|uniref:phospholipid transfer protein n=1 Tax=Rhinatrema bivittatum TaxID=194408 RepID=UPI0011264866|nr:phospholipid transfer protein [Rhinatrema bivittatum]XP_029469507.1 phospholipid transfer protein [Rhinatrema bivittatum]XP_029469508.1 phospholipid transfer protein [Rhinatrema bivittatum]XP_029469509.1 phospholipid transfer protein [Rhinatrema bivittatum]
MALHQLFLILLLPWLVAAATDVAPGCKIRITTKGLEFVKQEGLKFVEQELENLTIPDLSGNEGKFQYKISNVMVTHLQLSLSNLHFQPLQDLVFDINNASISLSFQRKLLYWFFYDVGSINASAEGVDIKTELKMAKDMAGRLKIANITCKASIAKMQADFGGTLRTVYDFLGSFLTSGIRFLVNQQICPLLNHAGLVLLNSLLDTVPVRSAVDEHIGIDYSLLSDPDVTEDSLDMNFKGMFFHLNTENETLPNLAVSPVIKEQERMVYVGLSEYFFDSAMYAYYKADILQINITEEKMPKNLEVLLRTTYFGNIMLLNPDVAKAPLKLEFQVSTPPRFIIKPLSTTVSVTATVDIFLMPADLPPVQLSSMTMELKLNARVSLKGKRLQVQMDLKKFRMYSNKSALESLALIPLQSPVKTLLQLVVMPIVNEKTKRGVQIPLPEGMDFTKETVTNHAGFIVIGGDLHFSKSLREVIEKYRTPPTPKPTASD